MNLIAIVIALAVEHFLSRHRRWRAYDWFARYVVWWRRNRPLGSVLQSAWGLVILVPPLLAVAVPQHVLHGGVWSLLGLLFAVAVLVFVLGPRDLWDDVRDLIAARREGDNVRAEALTAVLCGRRSVTDGELVRGVVVGAHDRLFGVLFWFFVLGPLGAVLYRLASALPGRARDAGAGEPMIEAALRLHALLSWIPLRLTALLYGLAGSTDDAIRGWRRGHRDPDADWSDRGWRVLARAGMGALQLADEGDREAAPPDVDRALRDALGLVARSVILLLGALAAFTIGGWVA